MAGLLTCICVTRPQWFNWVYIYAVYLSGHNWFNYIDRGFQTCINTGPIIPQYLNEETIVVMAICICIQIRKQTATTKKSIGFSGWTLMNMITYSQIQAEMLIAHSKKILQSKWIYFTCTPCTLPSLYNGRTDTYTCILKAYDFLQKSTPKFGIVEKNSLLISSCYWCFFIH